MKNKNVKTLLKICLLATITITVVIVIRIFLLASFKIPSSSMYPTLLPGDFVLVNKLIPGPRLDWVNNESGTPLRIKGCRTIMRNDILVFNEPYHKSDKIEKNLNKFYVKRCISIPGDTFYIKDGIYKVKNIKDTLGYYKYQQEVISHPLLKDFIPKMFKDVNWTITSFGPIYIPRKDTDIKLDSINFLVYKNLIEYETNHILKYIDNCFLLNGEIIDSYHFRQNYYFVVGDFALDSGDSRYWGLLPEDHIIGKVSYIWKSKDPDTGKYRLDRFFKSVD